MEQENLNSSLLDNDNNVSELISRLNSSNIDPRSQEFSNTRETMSFEQEEIIEKNQEKKRMEMLEELFDEISKFV